MHEPYAVADLTEPAIPRRSGLYSLEPIGRATPFVESLTSYIIRLAEAHCMQTRQLAMRALAPSLGWSRDLTNYLVKTGHALNGIGLPAARTALVLEDLTAQSGLALLTLRPWHEVLATRGLLRRCRAWCATCYQTWNTTDRPVYDPLLWSLACVKVCPVHHCLLSSRCPHCALDQQPVLAPWSRPGHCARCGVWLGSHDGMPTGPAEPPPDFGEEQWRALAVGELLASSTTPCTRPQLTAAFMRCALSCPTGKMGTLARLLRMPRNTVWLWCQGQVVPSLGQLLQVCACLGVTPRQFLTGQSNSLQVCEIDRDRRPSSQGARRSPLPFAPEQVRRVLAAILADDVSAPSMDAVGRQLGYGDRLLYMHFPDLCKAIAARYQEHVAQRGRERLQHLCAAIRLIVFDIRDQGIEPTRVLVEEQLRSPGILRDRMVREAMITAIAECKTSAATTTQHQKFKAVLCQSGKELL